MAQHLIQQRLQQLVQQRMPETTRAWRQQPVQRAQQRLVDRWLQRCTLAACLMLAACSQSPATTSAAPANTPSSPAAVSQRTLPKATPLTSGVSLAPATVQQWLATSNIPLDHLSLYLYDTRSDQVLLEHRADAPMQPASVMKLVTTISAMALLGTEFSSRVELHISRDDTKALAARSLFATPYALTQPLVIRGYGHNNLQRRDLAAIAEELQRYNIAPPRQVVLDRSWLELSDNGALFDENPFAWYNVKPDALLLEQNLQWYQLASTQNAVSLRLAGISAPVAVDSRALQFSQEPCRQASVQQLSLTWHGSTAAPRVTLKGRFPRNCQLSGYAQLLPRDWGWQAAWQPFWPNAQQVPFHAATHDDTKYALLTSLQDDPLHSRIRSINKYSDNVQARTLFLQLAPSASEQAPPTNAALQGEPQVADPDRSATRVRQWLQSIGLSTDTLQLENGAGLSRTERVSAQLLGELLRWQWQQPTRFEFVASLPVAGVDGTLKQRFAGQPAAQCARLKTGTLRNTTALAGYIFLPKQHEPIVFVALVNDDDAASKGVPQLNRWVNQLCALGSP